MERPEAWVEALCRTEGLDPGSLARYPGGSTPVYAAGDRVLKLYPPTHLAEHAAESAVLTAVPDRLPVLVPRLRVSGRWDAWGFVVMDRLDGVRLKDVWPMVGAEARLGLVARTGELAAALHAVPLPTLREDGPAFVAAQRTSAVARHRSWGLGVEWLTGLSAFLDDVALPEEPPVLLHSDLLPANLLVRPGEGDRWSICGVFDFDQARRGQREYDFVAPAVFLAEGDPSRVHTMLRAYGYAPSDLDHAFGRRLLAWLLLHRHGNLAAFLRRLPRPRERTFEALAERWFG